MAFVGIDHVAVPTDDCEAMLAFYRRLGFGTEHESEWRAGRHPLVALIARDNKINLHPPSLRDAALRAPAAVPGCLDICVVWDGAFDDLLRHLNRVEVSIEAGPVQRLGGRSSGTETGTSVYVRDPDGNLLEFIVYRGH